MDAARAEQPVSPGMVAIQDGRVVVRMPTPESSKPTIAPGPHVVLKVNGQVVTQSVPIDESDEVIVEATPEPPTVEVKIEISPDGSEAIAHIIRHPGVNYAVREASFAVHVDVLVRPVGKIPAISATAEQVKEALAQAGVVFGIDEAAIAELVARPELQVKGVVARGEPPTEPIDGYVRPYGTAANGESDADGTAAAGSDGGGAGGGVGSGADTGTGTGTSAGITHADEAGPGDVSAGDEPLRVDLLYRGEVSSVREGEVVAEWIDPVPGKDGKDVRGRPLRARRPKPVRAKLGKGVIRHEGSRFIIATRMGRPVISDKLVDVVPSYEVRGDVNVETGHVEFAGDVTVRGNVEESLRVRAGGSVSIGGMVYRKARIEAGGFVSARGVVGGFIEAGGNSGAYGPIADLLRKLAPLYQGAFENLRRIESTLAAAGNPQPVGIYFKALLERHFREAVRLAEELGKLVSGSDRLMDDEIKQALLRLVRHLTGRGPLRVETADDLVPFAETLAVLPVELDALIGDADVKVGYLQNAEIISGGAVVVTGRACYNSKVIARSGFTAPNASIRGGTVNVTQGDVVAKEIGSPSAAMTEITVSAKGSIKADVIYPNVLCVIGVRQYRFDTQRRRVVLRLDPQTGELLF